MAYVPKKLISDRSVAAEGLSLRICSKEIRQVVIIELSASLSLRRSLMFWFRRFLLLSSLFPNSIKYLDTVERGHLRFMYAAAYVIARGM